jgi:hypothetical protein
VIITKKQLIKEVRLFNESYKQVAWEVYMEYYDDEFRTLIDNVVDGVKHERWITIPFEHLKRIWEGYIKTGEVRDVHGMEEIKDQVIRNIAKLEMNSVMVGHTPRSPKDEIKEAGYCFREPEPEPDPDATPPEPIDPNQLSIKYRDERGKFWGAKQPTKPKPQERHRQNCYQELNITQEEFFNRLDDYIGDDTFSDYATNPLVNLAYELIDATTPEKQLLICDQIFNVVHARGDIAALFVQGGSRALSQLSGEHADRMQVSEDYHPMGEAYRRHLLLRENFDRGQIRQELNKYICDTLGEFSRNMNGRQSWEVVPFDMWERVRTEFFKYGFVRSHDALMNIISVLTHNIIQLAANSIITHTYGGHLSTWERLSGMNESDYEKQTAACIQKYGIDDEELGIIWDYLKDDKGVARISDTTLGQLYRNLEDLNESQTPEQQIVIIDHIFDISHPRSDLASWLIQGGSASLSKLTSQ